ncbi:MAG: long-chain fatty acid--CoA ligase [Spirochaetota bacterium]|nr:long-chain fatty acid--CoA ligase [Spirochaetota bacterium]
MTGHKEVSIAAIFLNRVNKYRDRACITYKKGEKYVDISWNHMYEKIQSLGQYLISVGIKKGDRISIFSLNRYEWWIADMAILSIRAISVPIDATSSLEEAQYVIDHSGSKVCFIGDDEQLQKIIKVKRKLSALKWVIAFDKHDIKKKDVIFLDDALNKGREYKNTSSFKRRLNSINPSDMATIIYNFGAIGNPRGIMLSHDNIVANINQILENSCEYMTEDSIVLSSLPFSHAMERIGGYYMPIAIGAKVAFAESFSKIEENLLEVRPTNFINVPRLYERICEKVGIYFAQLSPFKRAVYCWAMKIASKNVKYACNNLQRKGLYAILYNIADGLVYTKLKESIGMDRIKTAMSGGGPLPVSVAEFFLGIDITILEGYGLTETTAITHANMIGKVKPGTVGVPIKDTKINLSNDGEVLIKGPQVMLGYYKDKKATKEIFTKDGFLKTGDIGELDNDGYLAITGRIKDIIITSGGKNISPQNIERSLKLSRYIDQVAIIGDKRKYLTALIIPSFDEIKEWARCNNITFMDNNELIENERIVDLFEKEVAKYSEQFSRLEQIKRFILLNTEWTQETEEFTPTLKVNRRVIEEKYANKIDSMYPPNVYTQLY